MHWRQTGDGEAPFPPYLIEEFGSFCESHSFDVQNRAKIFIPGTGMFESIFTVCRRNVNLKVMSHIYPSLQVLGISEEPGGVIDELHEVHHQPTVPALPLHCGLRSAGHAAVWGQVQNQNCHPITATLVLRPEVLLQS